MQRKLRPALRTDIEEFQVCNGVQFEQSDEMVGQELRCHR